MWDVIQNRRVLFGAGQLGRISEVLGARNGCPGEGRRPSASRPPVFAMIYGSGAQVIERVKGLLDAARIPYLINSSLRGEPSVDDINRIAKTCVEGGCGSVLAIGGGSVLDAAKAVAMLATNGGTVEQYQMEGKPIDIPALPLIAVPTTSGTGSEATKVSVVYNPSNKLKKSFYSPYMIADTVILDPELTASMPRPVTVSTGVDALSHAIESYVSLNATPYTEMYGMQAMKLIYRSLKRAADNPSDMDARSDMLLASYLGGCALNAGIGLAHIIAQPLGGLLKIPHGVACAIYLPYAMEYNLEHSVEKYGEIARVFGGKGDGIELARDGLRLVKEFLTSLDAPDSIRAYAPADFDIDHAVESVCAATGHIKCNPRPVDSQIIRKVISNSFW